MSAATANLHTPAELHHEGTAQCVAVFSSASRSKPGTRNYTYVALDTREVACECSAPSGTCWHCDYALVALAMTRVAGFVAGLDDDALVATATIAKTAIVAGTATTTDTAVYWQARVVWLARREAARAALAPVVVFPVTTEVAA